MRCIWCVWICESINAWMYGCNLNDYMNCIWKMNSMRQNTIGKMGGGLSSQYKHSTNFLADDIIVNKSSRGRGKTRYKVATDVSWGWSSLLTQSLEEIAICRPAQSVPPLARFSSHAFLFYFVLKIPNFCLDRPFGFSIHRECVSFYAPYFLPGPPFRVFSPPGRSLLPKSPFQAFNLASPFDDFLWFFLCMTASCLKRRSSPWCLAMFLFRSVTVLEAVVDVRFHYSWIQRRWVCCSHFSKDVKKVFVFWKFLLQVLLSK